MRNVIKKDDPEAQKSTIYDFSFDQNFGGERKKDDYDFPHFHWQKEYSRPSTSKAERKIFKKIDFTPLLDESTYGRPPAEDPPESAYSFPFADEEALQEIRQLLDHEQTLHVVSAAGNEIKIVVEKSGDASPDSHSTDGAPESNEVPAEAVDHGKLQELQQEEIRLGQQVEQRKEELEKLQQELEQTKEQLAQVKEDEKAAMEKARSEADAIREEARKSGEEKGRQELLALESEKLDKVKASYQQTIARLGEAAQKYEKAYMEAEQNLIDLAIHVASNVVNTELKTNHLVIVGQVKKAIVELINREQVMVKVSPGDYDALMQARQDVIQSIPSLKVLNIEKDESLDSGSCVVENEYGSVHASTQSSMREIEQSLKDT
ncbi:FliH/SctL family protein [Desulfurispira natronophila]|uniref:Flagellar assembly protein FliH n=1 Tax=Desulfurispira natronophila TaxID=682562 RepID=A0A7W7Y5D2_9BACT|nr:FliH/SctL family protein [Desulfurispira natronophila]MBB5022393.1 flagellar assembly protein FliH [Desulfurispira natronophila]